MNKKSSSSFWSNKFFDDIDVDGVTFGTRKSPNELYKMAAAKRAVSNFVNIVTNDVISVKFESENNSYTDGKTVVIGSNISSPDDFDVAVGLALHEGSHIKLSDFDLLKKLDSIIPQECYDLGANVGYISSKVQHIIKDLWNVIEDRRIDNYIYSISPGYRGYYQSMYSKYFNNEVIDEALVSDTHTDETLNSYMFRIINLHNPKTRVTALKQLREIYRLIGLGTIDRLKTSSDALDVAIEVYKSVIKALMNEKSQPDNKKDNGDGEPEMGESQDGGDKDGGDKDGNPETNESQDGGDFDYEGGLEVKKFNESLRDALEEAIRTQQKFLDGTVEKEQLDTIDENQLDAMEEAGIELNNVGTSIEPEGNYNNQGVTCIVIKKLTQELLQSSEFPLTINSNYGDTRRPYQREVDDGIMIGTRLGKKLQVRSESRNTVFNRQKNGKIDKRMISSLGYGNESVFYYNELDQFNKANLHFSIDASGSMSGPSWRNTITNVTALCKAVNMIQNLDIQVSIRTTGGNNLPYIIMAYDSRVDNFSKVKEMFPCFSPGGTTPEGLCFEAIERNFIPSSNTMDSYFVNISDGEPYYGGEGFTYSGPAALKHTREQVKKLRSKGIKVLSYFVSGSPRTEHTNFSTMYGESSRFIDVTNVGQITKTMNNLFLSKK